MIATQIEPTATLVAISLNSALPARILTRGAQSWVGRARIACAAGTGIPLNTMEDRGVGKPGEGWRIAMTIVSHEREPGKREPDDGSPG